MTCAYWCAYCGRRLRHGTSPLWLTIGGERCPLHKTCHHRLTVDPLACGCDVCTGDLH